MKSSIKPQSMFKLATNTNTLLTSDTLSVQEDKVNTLSVQEDKVIKYSIESITSVLCESKLHNKWQM